MKFLKWTILLLLSLVLCAALIGCDVGVQKPDDTEADSNVGSVVGSGESEEIPDLSECVALTENGKPIYTLVYQSKNLVDGVEASELAKIANLIRDELGKKLDGVRFKVTGDRSLPDGKIIAVGSIEGISDGYFEDMRFSDYRIRENQGNIAFAAYRYSALYGASSRFLDSAFCYEGELYVHKDVLDVNFTATYQIGDVTLDGTPIDDYVISYESDSLDRAEDLRDLFKTTTGYLLRLEENSAAQKVIAFRKTSETDGYRIASEGSRVTFDYADVLGRELLWKHVERRFNNTTSGKVLSVESLLDSWSSVDGRKMMTYNVRNVWNGTNPGTRDNIAAEMILANNPDFICLQEFDVPYRNAYNGVIAQLYQQYAEVAVAGVDVNDIWNPIFYDKAKYTVLESGWVYFPEHCANSVETLNYPAGGTSNGTSKFRSFVWAVLKDVNDGSVYLIGNLHFSQAEDVSVMQPDEAMLVVNAVREIVARHEGCITLIGGDYNSRRTQSACGLATMLNEGFRDPYDVAIYKNNYGTTHADGAPTGSYQTGAIDHILTLNELSVQMYLVLTDETLMDASDHLPTIIQFSDKKT
ncbi:MAG: hypothetical protein IKC59_00570 [Clostridia bacterium]|nr:hypothetical protein [Clostridia bacterium]